MSRQKSSTKVLNRISRSTGRIITGPGHQSKAPSFTPRTLKMVLRKYGTSDATRWGNR